MRSNLSLMRAKLELEKINYKLAMATSDMNEEDREFLNTAKEELEHRIDYIFNNMCDHVWFVLGVHDENYTCQCLNCGKVKDDHIDKFGNRVINYDDVLHQYPHIEDSYQFVQDDYDYFKERKGKDYADKKILKKFNG